MAITRYGILSDGSQRASDGFTFPGYADVYILVPGVEKSITVPAGATIVYLSQTMGDVWVKLNAAAAVPVGDTTDGTAPILNPAHFEVKAGDVIHAISSIGGSLSVWYWER